MKKGVVISALVALLATVILVVFFRSTETSISSVPSVTSVSSVSSTSAAPVYFATMTHLEGNWTEAETNQTFFNRKAAELRYGMDIAEEYDAVLTLESELPFARGMTTFDDNVLAEALERGHGVGTHCDIPPDRLLTLAELTRELRKRKTLVDELVGEENNLGCSGVAGHDWYQAMVAAGFSYIDGIVGSHYLPMPLSERPNETWTDEALLTTYWHSRAPYDADQRYYPFFVNSDQDFEADADGELLISGGDLGGALNNFAEADPITGETLTCDQECPLTQEDVNEVMNRVENFLAGRDTTRVAKLQVYFPSSLFKSENEEVLGLFFAEVKALQEIGEIEWATQKEVYDAVLEWNSQ